MGEFTPRLKHSKLLKAGIAIVMSSVLYPFVASAQDPGTPAASKEMIGDTIFFADFGKGCGIWNSFSDAGLGSMSKISSLYTGGMNDAKGQFYAGNYVIVDNTERLRAMTTYNNTYLVPELSDHTHMVDSRQTADSTCVKGDPNSTNGRFLLVNGSTEPGVVFSRRVNELCRDSEFRFSAWAARAHGTQQNVIKNGKTEYDCRFQFEFWAEDPGDGILSDGFEPAKMVAGNTYAVQPDSKDAATVKQIKLLGKTPVYSLKEFTKDSLCDVQTTVNATVTDGGEECDVYTDGSGNYAYKKGGLWYEATGSSTETSANFSPTGTVLPSSTQLASVQVYSVKKHQRTDPVYSDGASYYDYNGSLYYQCSYSNGVVTHPSSGAKSVSSYSGDAFNVKINVGGTDYPAFIYTSTGGQADTLYHDGSNYYKVHFGYNSSTQPVIMDDTLAIWTAPAEAGAIESFTGTVPTTDQSEVYKTVVTYTKTVQIECEDPQKRWEELTSTFKLEGQDYCYLVLRNAYGNTTANDFAIDDISFVPYNPFNMEVGLGANATNTACKDNMVTITAKMSVSAENEQVVKNYISQYGFFFEGYNASTKTWVQLGSPTPLQVQSTTDALELSLPLNEYNLYSKFRIAVAATTAGFGGKCITFATPNMDATPIAGAPQFKISGKDICVDNSESAGGTTRPDKTGTFIITNTNSDGKGWKVRVKLPDGRYKWLVPQGKSCTTP